MPATARRVVIDIPTAEVFEPLLQPSRYKGAWGGRGGAKSNFFADLLIDYCLHRAPLRAVCVREIQKTLEQSVKRLLEDRIKVHGVGSKFRVMDNHIETPGDGVIIFQGMQNHTADSIKSLEGFDVAWVEEAQSLSERSLTLLRPTIRKPNSELWFSWNPRFPTDPVDVLLRSTERPPEAIVVESEYWDNPWFPDVLRKEMEWDRRRDPDKYEHVWAGDYEKHSEARVFKNWRVDTFETPPDAKFLFGADWGYSVDPAVLSRLWVDPNQEKRLFIDREAYEIGCEIDHLPALFDTIDAPRVPSWPIGQPPGMAREWEIIADSARPETISYMQKHGYPRLQPAKKGKDSVKEGVIFLQSYDIVIHERCIHTRDEYTHYSFKRDEKTDVITPILEDKKNHVIDSDRYAVEKLRKKVHKATW